MMKIFTMPSSTGSRRAMKWMKEHGVPFREQRLDHDPLSLAELKQILLLTNDGTDDIISTRSLAYKALEAQGVNIEDMTITELCEVIADNPRMLRYPIIYSGNKLMVGFDEDRVRVFLPRMKRMATYARQLEEVRTREDIELNKEQLQQQALQNLEADIEDFVTAGAY